MARGKHRRRMPRQRKAMYTAVAATASLFLFAAGSGITETAVHGPAFAVFRETGAGETGPGGGTDAQFLARQSAHPDHKVTLAAAVTPARLVALRWAQTQAGKPYIWGGTGPGGYDCSGLVMMAYRHAGIGLPRTTTEMLASPLLVLIPRSEARRGDLAFYGPGHVELYMGNDDVNVTFGAHDSGSVIGPIEFGWGWVPTMYFAVR